MKRQPVVILLGLILFMGFSLSAFAMSHAPKPQILTGYRTIEGTISLIGNVPFTELVLSTLPKSDLPVIDVNLTGKYYHKLERMQNCLVRVEGTIEAAISRYTTYLMTVNKYQLLKGGND